MDSIEAQMYRLSSLNGPGYPVSVSAYFLMAIKAQQYQTLGSWE